MRTLIKDIKKTIAGLDANDPQNRFIIRDIRNAILSIRPMDDSMTIDELIETLEKNLEELSKALDNAEKTDDKKKAGNYRKNGKADSGIRAPE